MIIAPGFIASYDRDKRTVRVMIPGITDGSDALPEAEFSYAIGDKSEHTEMRILPGDRVWCALVNGDPRYPVVIGYRPKQTGNSDPWRRWHHENFETEADEEIRIIAGVSIRIEAPKVTIAADSTVIIGKLSVHGSIASSQVIGAVGDVLAGGGSISLLGHIHTTPTGPTLPPSGGGPFPGLDSG